MSIIGIVIILALIGFLLWAIESLIPMDANIRRIIQIVVIIVVVLWLLQIFGLMPNLNQVRVQPVN